MEKSLDDLKQIRSMMERSTKFLSLSGMSGVAAGFFALLGAAALWGVFYRGWRFTGLSPVVDLVVVMVCVFILAGGSGFYFSLRKARRSGAKFWTPVARQILVDFAVPLLAGGALCVVVMLRDEPIDLIPALTLVFYGLALIAAGARTYREIRILGFCEIALGIAASLLPLWYSLWFWAFGFGVLHILYGIIMYFRYDRKA
jgi:hypothetical protein